VAVSSKILDATTNTDFGKPPNCCTPALCVLEEFWLGAVILEDWFDHLIEVGPLEDSKPHASESVF
jgi:hypothetical protein